MRRRFVAFKLIIIVSCTLSGFPQLFLPIESLVADMYWVQYFPEKFVRFIGFYEIVCALGFSLSLLIKKYSHRITIITSLLLSAFMFGAMAANIYLGRPSLIVPSLSFFAISIYILYYYLNYSKKNNLEEN